jgi:general stress protein YciG
MDTPKKLRGFAAISLERRREISRMGGLSVPPEKRLFAVDPQAASKHGRKGGKASAQKKRVG